MINLKGLGLALAMLFSVVGITEAKAADTPGRCTGNFVNPITDVCWSCLFPLTVGELDIIGSKRPDPNNPDSPICLCGSPIPRIGISIGFWEPVRLVDVTNKPWCFPNLAGTKLDPGLAVGRGKAVKNRSGSNSGSKYHVHYYIYPLLYWMEILTDFICLESTTFDVAYVSEVDPLWQDDALSALINPEIALFSNQLAQAACAVDCVASTTGLPVDELFWCAGCLGPMYPMNGNVNAHVGHIQASRLIAARMTFKMHRLGLAHTTAGPKALCKKYISPIIRKQQYRMQAVNPVARTKGRYACPNIGSSDIMPGSGTVIPAEGEDFGYLMWRKRNCCVGPGL